MKKKSINSTKTRKLTALEQAGNRRHVHTHVLQEIKMPQDCILGKRSPVSKAVLIAI